MRHARMSVVAAIPLLLLVSLASSAAGTSLPDVKAKTARSAAAGKARPFALISAQRLQLRDHVADIAADGERVAVSFGNFAGRIAGCNVAVWRPKTRALIRVAQPPAGGGARFPGDCAEAPSFWRWSSLALAGDRVAWVKREGGISIGQELVTASVRHASAGSNPLAGAGGCCAASVPWEGTHLGYVVGRGPLMVFSTWTMKCVATCSGGPTLTSQTVWRVADGGGTCGVDPSQARESPHCAAVNAASEPLVPLDVDGGRILILRDRSIDLVDVSGRALRTFAFATEPPLGAVLSGSNLAVLVQGGLRVFDTATGSLEHEWPLPDVPSGGHCGNLGDGCFKARLELEAAAGGLALYLLDGKVHILRLNDGRDVTVARATAADLTTAGLFYAAAFSGPYPGRVRFIPFAQLPLRAG